MALNLQIGPSACLQTFFVVALIIFIYKYFKYETILCNSGSCRFIHSDLSEQKVCSRKGLSKYVLLKRRDFL